MIVSVVLAAVLIGLLLIVRRGLGSNTASVRMQSIGLSALDSDSQPIMMDHDSDADIDAHPRNTDV